MATIPTVARPPRGDPSASPVFLDPPGQTERILAALEHGPSAVAVFDVDDRLIYSNRLYREYFNLGEKPHTGIGLTFEELLWRHVRSGVKPTAEIEPSTWIAERLAHHNAPRGPLEQRLSNGRWVRVNETIRPEGGTVVFYTDVTDLKTAERSLSESEARLSAIIAGLIEGVVLIDGAGTIRLVNPAIERLFGLGAGELIGRNVSMLMPEPDRGRHDSYLASFNSTGIAKVIGIGREVTGLRKDGTTFPLELGVTEIKVGAQRGYAGVLRDISERRRAEDAIVGQKTLLSSTLDAMTAHIAILDHLGRIIAVNKAWRDFARDNAAQSDVEGADYLGVCDRASGPWSEEAGAVAKGIRDVLAGHLTNFVMEYPCHAPNERRWFTLRVARFGEGDECKVVVSHENITQRREAENALAERAEQLARSNAELEQFAYVASHDLQEPLRLVGSYCQLLAKRYAGKLDADADEFIGYAVEASKRMQRLINDLLAYSRLDRQHLQIRDVDLEGLVERVRVDLAVKIAESRASIRSRSLPTIRGDVTQLGQLIQNLVSNSLKYRAEDRPPVIDISARREGQSWTIAVADNGIGFDQQFAQRIFLIFQRLHPAHLYSGSGIGLAVCKKIVERHRGRIWAESRPHRGTTFFFTLPDIIEEPSWTGSANASKS